MCELGKFWDMDFGTGGCSFMKNGIWFLKGARNITGMSSRKPGKEDCRPHGMTSAVNGEEISVATAGADYP